MIDPAGGPAGRSAGDATAFVSAGDSGGADSRRGWRRTWTDRFSSASVSVLTGVVFGVAACSTSDGTSSPDVLRDVRIAPAQPRVAEGESVSFTAVGVFEDGSRRNVSEEADWSSSDPAVVRVSNVPGSRGHAEATGKGTARISARFDAMSAATDMRVVAAIGPAAGPLRVDDENPRYFATPDGEPILLAGSHTWESLQDAGPSDPPEPFDYGAYLDFLDLHGHNFFRLWAWEQAKWTAETPGAYYISPLPWARTGPGTARDGKPRFDLTRFNVAYFERLRRRVREAGDRGIYVSVMLFNGWSVEDKDLGIGNPWPGHPFHSDNNVNGIAGDVDGDGEGEEIHTLADPAVTSLQEAYVRRVVEAVGDLDNVLYEISNESHSESQEWQYHMIRFIRGLQAEGSTQHPVGMTVEWRGGDNAELHESPADWISPDNSGSYLTAPPPAEGRKVIVSDTDHYGTSRTTVDWVWKSFTRGLNPAFMDAYDGAATGLGAPANFDAHAPRWVGIRRNLGYAKDLAERVDLETLLPEEDLSSTGYCLARATAEDGEYLVFATEAGEFTVDLSATPGALSSEWFDPATGTLTPGASVEGGGRRSFTSPFGAPAVLRLRR